MKVAIVHEWLVNFRGSERVLLELARMFPDAVIYVSVLDRSELPAELANRDIRTTFINRLPLASKLYKLYLPLMPRAYEELDLTEYDLIISSSHACAKGIVPPPSSVHICYCYTPMRYAWNGFHEYRRTLKSPVMRWLMGRIMHRLRQWDVSAAARVDQFVACSHEIQRRIEKYYRRDSTVIFPPVEAPPAEITPVGGEVRRVVERFEGKPFFLCLGRLVYYKRVDIAVDACTHLKLPLVVAGDGPELKELMARAGPSVKFVRTFTDADANALYDACGAFLFPGNEDFGITVVEAQLHGKPVIAFGSGGALDTVADGESGILFYQQYSSELVKVLDGYDPKQFQPEVIKTNADRFSVDTFRKSMKHLTTSLLEKENAKWARSH